MRRPSDLGVIFEVGFVESPGCNYLGHMVMKQRNLDPSCTPWTYQKKRVWMHLNPTIIIWLPIVETPILSGLVALTILKNMSSWMGRINYPIYEMENKKCMKPPTSFQGICRSRRFRVPPTRAQRQRRAGRAGRAGRGVGGEVLELLGQSLRLADTLLTHRYTHRYIYIYIFVFMYHEMLTNTYIYMYI